MDIWRKTPKKTTVQASLFRKLQVPFTYIQKLTLPETNGLTPENG